MVLVGGLVAAAYAPGRATAAAGPATDDRSAERQESSQAEFSAAHREWLQVVGFIIEDREKAVFEGLGTEWQRQRFIAEFWRRRDPLPVTPENEFYIEHMRRWTYAEDVLGRDTPTPGWRTDRGRVYIVNGPPFKVHRYPNTGELWPLEVWEYRDTPKGGMPSFYQIIFFKPRLFSEWRLYSPSVDGPEGLVIGTPMDVGRIDFRRLATQYPIVFTAAQRVAAGYSALDSEVVIARTMVPLPPPRPFVFATGGEAEAKFLSAGPLPLAIEAIGFVHDELEGYVDLTVEVLPTAATFVELDAVAMANYGVELEITSPAAGTWREPGGQLVVRIPLDEFEAVRDLPIVYRKRLWLLPGDYRVRALLREAATERVGAAEVEVTVPAASDLVVGSPQLFYVTEGGRDDWNDIIPWVGRAIRRGYPVSCLVPVALAGVAVGGVGVLPAGLEIDYRIRQAGVTVWRDSWAGTPPGRRGQDAWEVVRVLHVEALPVGSYDLEVSARLRAGGNPLIDLGVVGRRKIEIVDEFLPFARIMPLRRERIDRARGHHQIGQQLLRRDDFEAAGKHFQAAVRLEPQITAYQVDAAKTLLLGGDLKMAAFFLDAALQREPRNAEAWATHGVLRVRQADFDGAIEAYQRSLDLAPGTPAIYNGLAESYLSTGQTERALVALEQSLEINPEQQQVRELRDRLRGDGAH